MHWKGKHFFLETNNKKTLVIGASEKPHRYSYSAVQQLQSYGFQVAAIGLRKATIGTTVIETGFPEIENTHTVTIYIGPQHQPPYYDYLVNKIKPARIIFNPGTENPEFYALAQNHNIEVVENCTLMMLSHGEY